jgi:hypothetical protein
MILLFQPAETSPSQRSSRESVRTIPVLVWALIAGLIAMPVFSGTKIVHRWVLTAHTLPKIENVLVIAILENYIVRQELEDEMERLLPKSGIHGVKSHMVLPPRNELLEGELKQRIKDADFDAVLMIRPKDVREELEQVVGPYYLPPPSYYHLWPYWDMAWSRPYGRSSYQTEKTIVTAEFNLYDMPDEELLWSGETETVYSKDFRKLGREYANAVVKQLRKDHVIGNK